MKETVRPADAMVDGDPRAQRAQRARRHAERNLSASIVAIEFTLISVMVGVVLFPLVEEATVLLRERHYEYWPYIAAGLALTLYLWAAVISHSLTFIGWPMDFGHNLLYITLALVLAIQAHFLDEPVAWFAITPLSAGIAALTVYYDLRVVRQRLPGATGAAAEVFAAALEQQRRQLRLTPWYALQVLVPLALVIWLPGVFIERPVHVVLLIVQMLFTAAALAVTIRSFRGWSPLILRRAAEELEAESR
jgi:hypothetical protein